MLNKPAPYNMHTLCRSKRRSAWNKRVDRVYECLRAR